MSRSPIESDYEFGAYEDDYRGFDIRDDDSNRGPLILALALGIMIVFGAVVWNTYRQGVRASDGALPIIAAAETPYKRAIEDKSVIKLDRTVRLYDQMDGAGRPPAVKTAVTGTVKAQTLPPLPVADVLQGGPEKSAAGIDPMISEQARMLESLNGSVDTSTSVDVASVQPIVPPPAEPRVSALPTSPAREIVKTPKFDFDSEGHFLVQISALRSKEAAERAWREAIRKSPDLFSGGEKRIQRADLGAKGVFFRLQIGAFAQRAAAIEFCNALKSAKHQCIVVQK